LDEVLKQKSETAIRRTKMEHKSSERTKPKNKKIRFNLYVPGTKRVFLEGDSSGCMLVVPEAFGTHERIPLYQGRLPEYHL
jgi:hypothetical protein